jgi:hypothetical protein
MTELQPGIGLDRRRLLLGLGVALAPLAGGRLARAADEEARPILEKAAKAMAETSSFHFTLETEDGTTTIMEGLEIVGVEGDVVRPASFQANVKVKLAIVTLDLAVVGIGDRVWVTDPMSSEGGFIEVTEGAESAGSIQDLLNPDRLLLQAVDLVENPRVAGEDDIDGVTTTRIEGTFDPRKVGADIATPTAGLLELKPMPVAIWIDEVGHVLRLRAEGALTEAENPRIARQLHLTKFDEPITIEPPAEASPEA